MKGSRCLRGDAVPSATVCRWEVTDGGSGGVGGACRGGCHMVLALSAASFVCSRAIDLLESWDIHRQFFVAQQKQRYNTLNFQKKSLFIKIQNNQLDTVGLVYGT